MFIELLRNLFFFALHVDNSSVFPKPLSKKEEEKYFIKMSDGNELARTKLIEHNLRLVAHIVKKYASTADEQDDLISVGTVGLIKAVSTFDHTKGAKFATYASRCIENEILMQFRAAKKSAADIYINEPVETDKDGNSISLIDLIDDGTDIHEQVDMLIRSRQLYSFLTECLEKRELELIIYRYGLYGSMPHTQNETAEKLGISRSYVSRIEKRAINKLKKMFENTPF
ncbi:RNA polymerase sporulation sigma factor SigK [Ruminococcus flavefaciens]|uniref:RNA polymerase sporulation sigma factor SigK n=1 Tax=Ruminococcus flavefaciens TaxID=1265 RepID=UPI0026ECEC65|nr:RNA polymerase sporulation sigma factor SigK [Ruminococcus flavefaciens]MDD7516636.1 RNA polymerase sporulation sigma factor SigK [Ruminococcus flavefaciens]MDY5691119.1 RNA polymerase sporulation sigma factor SigK [Ruminococcus flavefaciens]